MFIIRVSFLVWDALLGIGTSGSHRGGYDAFITSNSSHHLQNGKTKPEGASMNART